MAETETRNRQDPATTKPVNISGTRDESAIIDDPFASQRSTDNDPFAERRGGDTLGVPGTSPGTSPKRDRQMSKEWDASKVPPSRFQKREGSIYATPGSRDGHVGKNTQTAFTEKLKEKGWL
ncbi:hypothetical protein FGG08_000029 [Glutinoglossum americanum]|uniref:Uncharacterized protein n=1 Tax=Glutinoglossum americanum TaxID=1670608 RepID=A0A9P8L1P6_9PEZI|nr:hypothetical protein FGG08_000029 [Glutinoglossum americanum]